MWLRLETHLCHLPIVDAFVVPGLSPRRRPSLGQPLTRRLETSRLCWGVGAIKVVQEA